MTTNQDPLNPDSAFPTPTDPVPAVPEATILPAVSEVPGVPEGAPESAAMPEGYIDNPASLDEGTYTSLRTPKGQSALALDGAWHQISPRYVTSQLLQNGIILALIAIAAPILVFVFGQTWAWIPAGIFAAITIVTLIILPRQARAIGYMLRGDDIVFRKGILWQRMIAVPYGRLQLVDITQGPLDRAFGISQLKMVTAAATTGVQIPGLTHDAAETLRDTLIVVAETRRTGL